MKRVMILRKLKGMMRDLTLLWRCSQIPLKTLNLSQNKRCKRLNNPPSLRGTILAVRRMNSLLFFQGEEGEEGEILGPYSREEKEVDG